MLKKYVYVLYRGPRMNKLEWKSLPICLKNVFIRLTNLEWISSIVFTRIDTYLGKRDTLRITDEAVRTFRSLHNLATVSLRALSK